MSMLHEITRGAPRNKHRKRKGRGESSGHGKTSGRGNKGAKARVGTYIKRGHEGGQTPIFRRFPKRGFSNDDFANRFAIINISALNAFKDGATVDAAAMREAGLVPNDDEPIKVLGEGELTRKLTVQAAWYTKSAHAKILAAGGAAQNLKGEAFEFPKPKHKFVPREPVKKKPAAEPAAEGAPAGESKPEGKSEAKGESKSKAPRPAPAENPPAENPPTGNPPPAAQ
jgi:large subunit ribosomal protein L15